MGLVWILFVVAVLIVYPVVLMRSAGRGRRWALDTLEAMQYMSADAGGPRMHLRIAGRGREDGEQAGRLLA
jgi:hypothetical protein